MKFSYLKEPAQPSRAHPGRRSILRPRIRIRLKHRDRFIDLLALVDSGADDCLFPLDVARLLRLDFDPANSHLYAGIGQGAVTATFQKVMLEVGGWSFILYAGFSDSPTVVPILGQNGFFDLFEVKFNKPKELVELKQLPEAA